MLIKKIRAEDYPNALSLVLTVFLQYEAPDYPEQGVQSFKAAISDQAFLDSLEMWGAYSDDNIFGVIAFKNQGCHIALLFVDSAHHRKGIGRSLFETALETIDSDIITVNSSPYAVEFYRKLGFIPTSSEQCTDGILYTPMTYTK
ncbi:GNAT family N-acetyltransferase [Oscillospiraceae bacterium LTW-04]|nr:GNAT family N-acetyltransferase [Oscillospiraceae bacterium MB24-C1]